MRQVFIENASHSKGRFLDQFSYILGPSCVTSNPFSVSCQYVNMLFFNSDGFRYFFASFRPNSHCFRCWRISFASQAEIFMENASHSYVTLKNSLQLKACLSHFVRHFESFLALFITLFHLVKLQF